MDIKLVATDMDGTFLDGQGKFDMERLKSLLVEFKEKGLYFAVASGRGILSLEKLFAESEHLLGGVKFAGVDVAGLLGG